MALTLMIHMCPGIYFDSSMRQYETCGTDHMVAGTCNWITSVFPRCSVGTKERPLGWLGGHSPGVGSWVPPCGGHTNTDGGTSNGRKFFFNEPTLFLLFNFSLSVLQPCWPSLSSQMCDVTSLFLLFTHAVPGAWNMLPSTPFASLTLTHLGFYVWHHFVKEAFSDSMY